MHFPIKLEQGLLIRRYKRFLADVERSDGSKLTIHCPNSGSMRSCSAPGSLICFSTSDNPKRKYPHTLEMVKVNGSWVGVNTSLTNALVAEAIAAGTIAELTDIETIQREVRTSEGNRLDLLVIAGGKKCYIEVKNCSLVENDCALFPDAVTSRGTKHLNELARLVEAGYTGIIFYLVQRGDAMRFEPAVTIDPLYAATLVEVYRKGVQILVYQAEVTPESIEVVRSLPFSLPG